MAIEKRIEEDKIEVVGDFRHIQIRTATVLEEDGVEISRAFHRRVIHPCTKSGDTWSDTELSGESAEVRGIAGAVWSDAVKTAYKAHVDSQGI